MLSFWWWFLFAGLLGQGLLSLLKGRCPLHLPVPHLKGWLNKVPSKPLKEPVHRLGCICLGLCPLFLGLGKEERWPLYLRIRMIKALEQISPDAGYCGWKRLKCLTLLTRDCQLLGNWRLSCVYPRWAQGGHVSHTAHVNGQRSFHNYEVDMCFPAWAGFFYQYFLKNTDFVTIAVGFQKVDLGSKENIQKA